MFEQGLVYFLKKFLNLFIENPEDPSIIKEKIHIGVWSGLIILENLVLKNTLFSLIDVPLSLVHGYIGRLEIRIPWGNLGIDPVTIIIDKIYLLMEPKYEWNPGAADKREQAMKQAKLVAAELFAKRLNTNSINNNPQNQSYSDYAKNWLFASFINKIIDNIEITIREVHIRYEDQLSCPSNFCIGITLASLHVQSRDHEFNFTENYSPSPVKGNQNNTSSMNINTFPTDMMDDSIHIELKTKGFETFHKLIQVNHLSIYWNPLVATGLNICGCSFKGRQPKEIQLFMFRTIPTRIHQVTDRPRHHYILFPIDINTYLDMSFNTSTGVAKGNVKVVISELSITLEDLQLREIISIATNMGSFAKLQRFSEFRPAATIFEDSAAWWRYAINAVLLQLRLDRKKHLKISIKQLSQRYKDKLVYIELWKSKLISPQYIINQLSQVDHTSKPTINYMNSSLYQLLLQCAKQQLHMKHLKNNIGKDVMSNNRPNNSNPNHSNRNSGKLTRGGKNISHIDYNATQSMASLDVNNEKSESLNPLNPEMIELLHALEYSLSFEDIVLFRSLAERNLSIETTHQSWMGGIMSWISAGVTGVKSNQAVEEEKRKLFEALKYDPERMLRGGTKEVNQNEVMTVIGVYMSKGSITLALTSPDINSVFQGSIPFLTLELEDLRNRTVLMGDGSHLKVNLSLQDFTAYEVLPSSTALNLTGTIQKSRNKILFRRILKGRSYTADDNSRDRYSDATSVSSNPNHKLLSSSLTNKETPLFATMIEMFPSNKDSDMLVQLQVEELEVWISPTAIWTSSMGTFVAWPSDLQYWSEMEMQSMNQLADFKARFDAKLEYMMNNHSNITIEANINAPVVIISDRASHEEKGDVLLIDLGLISLTTEKLAKAHRQKVLDSKSHTGFTSDATSITPVIAAGNSRNRNISPLNNDVAISLQFSSRELTPVKEHTSSSIELKSTISNVPQDESYDANDDHLLLLQHQSAEWDVLSENIESEINKDAIRNTNNKHPLQLLGSEKKSDHINKDLSSCINDQSIEGNNQNASQSRDSDDDVDSSNYASSYDGEIGGNKAAASSIGGMSTVNTEGIECDKEGEENLYDVFQCQISQIQVYLISCIVIKDGNVSVIDTTKAVIVNKFEVRLEIQVSVLPWDTSLPPVKLFLDIPEVNLNLSLQKLLRLKQFSIELVTDNSATSIITSNLAKINNLNKLLKKKSMTKDNNLDTSHNTVHSRTQKQQSLPMNPRLSFKSNSSIISLKSKKRRTISLNHSNDGVSVASDTNDNHFFDTHTGRLSATFQQNKNNNLNSSFNNNTTNNSIRNGKVKDGIRRRSLSSTSGFEGVGMEDRLKKLVESSYQVKSDDGFTVNHDNKVNQLNDYDNDDDDSFFSVEDQLDVEEHRKQKEHLQYVIEQRENMRTKLMTDIRVTEADPMKVSLHDTLKTELAMCEQELQQLRVAYVELLMSTEDLHRYSIEGTPEPSQLKDFSEELQLGMGPLTGNITEGNLGHKRDLAQASVFKIPSLQVQQQRREQINKELIFMKANILVVNIDLECVASETKLVNRIISKAYTDKTPKRSNRRFKKTSNPEFDNNNNEIPTITCRLTLTSINFKLRHRLQDSRIGFSLQELDVSDVIEYKYKSHVPNKNINKIFLLSSEPSNFGLFVLPMVSNRFNSNGGNDLLKVKYEVIYGNESYKSSDDTDEPDFITETTHNVKVIMGLLGISIEQNRIALLIHTIHRIMTSSLSSIPILEPSSKYDTLTKPILFSVKPIESKVDESFQGITQRGKLFPNAMLGIKIDCVCISMMQSCVPFSNITFWSLTSTLQCRSQSIAISCRLADLSIHYIKSHSQQRTDRVLICGRDTTSSLPFLSLSVHYDKYPTNIMCVPHVSVTTKTVPIIISADLDFIYEMIKEISTGPITETIQILSPPDVTINEIKEEEEAKQQPKVIGNTLNMILNPLLDSCNGQLEVLLGSITISSGGDGMINCKQQGNLESKSSSLIAMKSSNKTELIFTTKSIEAHMIWGDICESGAVQLSLVLQEMSLACCTNEYVNSIINPFDLFCKVHTMPSMYFNLPSHSDQADYVASLTFNSVYLPPMQPEINRNELQVAVSLSPLLFHVHEHILHNFLSWYKVIQPQIDKLMKLTCNACESVIESTVELMDTTPYGLESSSHELDLPIDFDLNVILLVYEVVLSIESSASVDNTLPQPQETFDIPRSFSSGKLQNMKNIPRTTPPNKVRGKLENIDYQPLFRLVINHISTQINVKASNKNPSYIDSSNNNYSHNITSDSDYLLSLNPVILLQVSADIDSVHFEYIKFSGIYYKRLLTTGIGITDKYAVASSTTIDSNTLYSTENATSSTFIHKNIFPDNQNYESKETLTSFNIDIGDNDQVTTNFLNYQSNNNEKVHFIPSAVKFISLEIVLDSVSDVNMNFNINNMHITLISEAILNVITLVDVYQNCIQGSISKKIYAPSDSNHYQATTTSRSSGVKSESKRKATKAQGHPSSVPMAPILSNSNSLEPNNSSITSKEILPTTLLSKDSLLVANLIDQIKCKVHVSNSYIYIPTEKQHGKGPALCISINLMIDGNTCPPINNTIWTDIIQDKCDLNNNIGIHRNIFQIKCSIDPLEVYFIHNIPIEISNPIVSLRMNSLFGQHDEFDSTYPNLNGEGCNISVTTSVNSLASTHSSPSYSCSNKHHYHRNSEDMNYTTNTCNPNPSIKMLLFPLHIEFVYTFSLSFDSNHSNDNHKDNNSKSSSMILNQSPLTNKDSTSTTEIGFLTNNKNILSFQQEILVNIETCEMQVFLDYSPLLRLYEISLQPIIDRISSQISTSTSTNTTSNTNTTTSNKSTLVSEDYSEVIMPSNYDNIDKTQVQDHHHTKKKKIETNTEVIKKGCIKAINNNINISLVQVNNLSELLLVMNNISVTNIVMKAKSIIIYAINDIYKQPISIARLNCNNLELNTSIYPPIRSIQILLASKQNIQPTSSSTTTNNNSNNNSNDESIYTMKDATSNMNLSIFNNIHTNKLQEPLLTSITIPDKQQDNQMKYNTTNIKNTSQIVLNVNVKAEIGVEYYNQRLIAREPLIEPFPLVIKFINRSNSDISNGPVIMILNSNISNNQESKEQIATYLSDYLALLTTSSSTTATATSNNKVDSCDTKNNSIQNNFFPPAELDIEMPRPIIINLSMALFEIAVVTFRIISNPNINHLHNNSNKTIVNNNLISNPNLFQDEGGGCNSSNMSGDRNTQQDVSILGIRNDSGLTLRYWTKEGNATEEVATNTEAPLQLEYYYENTTNTNTATTSNSTSRSNHQLPQVPSYRGIDGRYSTARAISVALHDVESNTWSAIHDIPLEGVGTRLFYIDFKTKKTTDSNNNDRSIEEKNITGGYKESKRSNKLKLNNELHYISKPKDHMIPSIALELVSKGGNKVLIVRSTMRLFNSTKITFKIELTSGFRRNKRIILWEALLPPNQGIPVPANLCDVPNGRFIVKPIFNLTSDINCEGSYWPKASSSSLISQSQVQPTQQGYENNILQGVIPFAAEMPCPEIPGVRKQRRNAGMKTSLGIKSDHTITTQRKTMNDNNIEDGSDSEGVNDSSNNTHTLISDTTTNDIHENEQHSSHILPSNFICWRKKLFQQRGALNTQTYSHWLNLHRTNFLEPVTGCNVENYSRHIDKDLCTELSNMKESFYCNANVCSKGALQSQAAAQTRSPECCMLRTITLSPPVTVVNLTAGEIYVAITSNLTKHGQSNDIESLLKLDNNIRELIPQIELAPGESWDFFASHANMDISCSFMISSEGYCSSSAPVSSVCKKWSKAILMPGCRSNVADVTVYNCDMEYQNGSVLSLQVEVMDRYGSRVISVYVPYWILSTSFLSLQYQHDTWLSSNYTDRVVNGIDGLAADQIFISSIGNKSDDSDVSHNLKEDEDTSTTTHGRGLGLARGMNGILLGPDIPIRGLVDVFNPVSTGLSRLHDRHSLKEMLKNRESIHRTNNNFISKPTLPYNYYSTLLNTNDTTSLIKITNHLDRSLGTYLKDESINSFRLVQCGYSFRDKRSSRIRLRTSKSSQWSPYLALDHDCLSVLDVISASQNESASEDIDITRAMPHIINARNSNSGGTRKFSFGVMIKSAEPPFNRTQIVMIVDRFHLNNTINHNIEVRQIGQNAIFNLRNQDTIPMWWRNGPQHLQMRLARYGWSWSGKFSIQAEGEVSIRLRNDFDNTVFFVLVQLILQGPSMYVVFKGGEKFSPYRFENHTLDTFKIKQKSQVTCTNLLPYHCCAYAWDEPLLPHSFTIDMLKNPLQSQDDWGMLGTFSFDCLGILSHAATSKLSMIDRNKTIKKTSAMVNLFSHLVLRVVAQGPTRVLQIFDRRILNKTESTSNRFKYYEDELLSSNVVKPIMNHDHIIEEKENISEVLLGIKIKINALGISLVDQVPQELIYIAISEVSIKHLIMFQQSKSNIDISRIQIDNQLWSTPYPSILYPLLPLQENETIEKQTKFISLVLHRDMKYVGVEYIPLFKLTMAPFDVNIDGSIVSRLVDTVNYIIELLETVHNTNSHAYSYRVQYTPSVTTSETIDTNLLPTTQLANSQSMKGTYLKSNHSVTIVNKDQYIDKNTVATQPDSPHMVSLSYYDAVDFVAHSPFACASPGTVLRPSQLDSIHTMMYTLSAQKRQYRNKLKDNINIPQHQQLSSLRFLSDITTVPVSSDIVMQAASPLHKVVSKTKSATVTTIDESDSQMDTLPLPISLPLPIITIDNKNKSKLYHKKVESNQYYLSNINRINLAHLYMNKALDHIALPLESMKPTVKLYIEHLEISEIRLNASFNPIINSEIRTNINNTISNKSLLQNALNTLMMAIGSAIAKIENCPISFKPYKNDHIFNSANNITNMLISNYTMQAISQAYLVFFSSEILGNPVRIIKAISEGLWDFLYLPTLGLFVSPKAFAVGVVQGTSSLLCNLIASILTTGGSLASSIQVGMIALGVIDPYIQQTTSTRIVDHFNDGMITNTIATKATSEDSTCVNTMKSKQSSNQSITDISDDGIVLETSNDSTLVNNQPRNILISAHNIHLIRPKTLLKGLHLGVSRFFLDPLTGFRNDGVKGLIIGLFKGTIGLFARPMYGTLGFTAHSLNRISFRLLPRLLANQKLRLIRSRPPRFFRSPNLPIKIYTLDENLGQELLSRIQDGDYRHEGYLWHGMLKDKSIILLTKVRIVIYSEGFDTGQILWNSLISSLMSIDVEYNHSSIVSNTSTTSSSAVDPLLTKIRRTYQQHTTNDTIQRLTEDSIPSTQLLHEEVSGRTVLSKLHSVQKQSFQLLGQNCQLVGSPILHIYHIPMYANSSKSNKKDHLINNQTNNKNANNSLRLSHKIILFETHHQLLEFFSILLPLHKNLLNTESIKYLTDANVNLEEAKKILELKSTK